MALNEGGAWESRFTRRERYDRRSLRAAAAEGNDQHRVSSVAQVSSVQRNDQHPVTDRRASKIRGPNLTPPGKRASCQRRSPQHSGTALPPELVPRRLLS